MKKLLLGIILLGVLSVSVSAELRAWTRKDGKTVKGVMVEKTETTVTLRIKSKEYTLKLDDLSEEDVKYVQKSEVALELDIEVKTLKRSSYIPGKKFSTRTIEISLEETRGVKLQLFCVWIGEGKSKDQIGVFKTEVKDIEGDGKHQFSVVYPLYPANAFDKQHKAYYLYVLRGEKILHLERGSLGNRLDGLAKQAYEKQYAQK